MICDDYDHLSNFVADIVIQQIMEKPDLVLGLATGSTPKGLYKNLVRANKLGKIDFSKVTTFNLDEYIGLQPTNPSSYHFYMYHYLLDHINIDQENINIPDGMSNNIEKVCKEYDEKIKKAGGIDLQILGIGHNGHIGFIEPDEKLKIATHKAILSPETIKANSRFFKSVHDVPKTAVTMGLGGILKSKKIMILASGEGKAGIIQKALNGTITTKIPASLLQLHPKLCVVLDRTAAKEILLTRRIKN